MQRFLKQTEEAKRKISEAKKGQKFSREHKINWFKSRWPNSKKLQELLNETK